MAMEVEIPRTAAQSAPAAKRRRKTGTAGAANDCFACQKKGIQCDRVRPYCGPCLKIGSNCSGYKTVLTWGVGVASRGKLRGKTLPIQKSPASDAPRSTPGPHTLSKLPSTQRQALPPGKRQTQSSIFESPTKRSRVEAQADRNPEAFGFAYPALQVAQPQNFQRDRYVPSEGRQPYSDFGPSDSQYDQVPTLHRLYTSVVTPSDESSMSSSTGSTWSSVSGGGYSFQHGITDRPPIYSPQSEVPQFVDPFLEGRGLIKACGQTPMVQSYDDAEVESRPTPSTPSSFNFDGGDPLFPTGLRAMGSLSPVRESPISEETTFSFALSPGQSNWDADYDFGDGLDSVDSVTSSSTLVPSIPRSSLDLPFFHLPKRMQFIMSYYDTAICPVLVAFDGDSNPYRMHIMHLAMQNEGLQNALAALVTNNIRMREIQDLTHLKSEPQSPYDLVLSPGNAGPEEEHYKAKSIEHLNNQLTSNNKQKASEDTVLATLLILCLFHVCNSGFSKFRTQLAGVQKLLRMRSRESRSPFVGWVEVFFAWLDVMTSAVNDREAEIRGDSLDMGDLSANLGALEQFSGCDGRLFKLIARLGRLNLLSQGRPVRDAADVVSDNRSSSGGTCGTIDFYSPKFDHRDDASPSERERGEDLGDGIQASRRVFWREWKELHARLWAWQSETTPALTDGKPSVFEMNMVSISESFRYSALLYIERLAHPEQPSGSPNIQDLVERALAHIEEIGVNTCVTKFMLWPLFITGTEAVKESHRNMIRDRCIEIQRESGFYNNLSGLKVLERVWRDTDSGTPKSMGARGQAFRWRMAMDRADGEYIVI